jgi:hypothetical protein
VAYTEPHGITPELLQILAGHLLGEILELNCWPHPEGTVEVAVRFLDTEARDWNAEVAASDMSDEEKAAEQWEEIFIHRYFVDPAVSRVLEIRDELGVIMESDPLPWSERIREPRTPQRSSPRQRPSALAEPARAVAPSAVA